MKVRKIVIDIILMCLTFYEPPIVPHYIFITFKYFVVIYLVATYIFEFKQIKKIAYWIGAYGLVTVVSSISNQMQLNTIVASIIFVIQIFAIFLLTSRVSRVMNFKQYCNILVKIFGTVILATDILMLFVSYDFANPSEEYLCGNKFVVAYLHCFASGLIYACTRNRKKMVSLENHKINFRNLNYGFLFSVYSVLICLRVTCSTGAIICVALVILEIIPDHLKSIVSSGRFLIFFTITVNVLIFGTYNLFENQLVQYFAINVLGKSGNFTGRFQIWNIIFYYIEKKPLMGYGYYNSIIESALSYGNPQNGILKLLLDSGAIGLLLYGALVWNCMKGIGAIWALVYPMIGFLYCMAIASFVEINLTHMVVFLTLAMISTYKLRGGKLE